MKYAVGLLIFAPSLLVLSLLFRYQGFRHYLKGVAVMVVASIIALLIGFTLGGVW